MDALLDAVAAHQDFLGPLVLFLSAAIEYVFPPFPGDTVTLFGAFLVASRGWSLALVLTVVTLGSLAGAALDYWLGRWLARRQDRLDRVDGFWARVVPSPERLRQLEARFARHGAVVIALNRFLPGLRAFFFVAAGMAGMPLWSVMLWGGVSALLWNGLIAAAGIGLGASFEELQALVRTYSVAVWILLGAILLGLLVLTLVRKSRARGAR